MSTTTTTITEYGSVRINFSVHKTKYPKVFEALERWKQNRDVISNKICLAIEELVEKEEKQNKGEPK